MVPFGKMDSGFTVQKFTYMYPQPIVLTLKYFKNSRYILVNTTATFTWNISISTILELFNRLKTKRRLLNLKTQFVPRSKHFSSQL